MAAAIRMYRLKQCKNKYNEMNFLMNSVATPGYYQSTDHHLIIIQLTITYYKSRLAGICDANSCSLIIEASAGSAK
jgi:hypothetical protein